MPELPEVHTTVEGLKTVILGKTITDVWSDFHLKTSHGERLTIKNKKYFADFRKKVVGAKIVSVGRIGKNILINIISPMSDMGKYTVVVHMKMTGHLMYGTTDPWVHLIFKLKNSKDLVLSDMRKFASVTLAETDKLNLRLGIDALDPKFSAKKLAELMRAKGKMPIKSALLDQTALAGIGNIYSDEILWQEGIHPLTQARAIPEKKFVGVFKSMQKILRFSISHGGDSKSDYRNAFGEKGAFQNFHKVYGKRKEKCVKRNCNGIIERIVVRGRSAHFCATHQKLYT
jgi:formamidopyrimidine-DNA glycosylase